ncbi:hypothetical protein SOVF_174450 [Spinacia oleracea]|uniref:Uncharacterized protein n=1 Tax=Spinacia oleracea TaxID=3562 RepID=A0A9R0IAU4_SPIOL|nr:uncharacterized protein LOC110785658 [Spinacia oleracea]KNA07157.1 hypothetical protein SOVF_174450 [Spinacia oleracea]
MNLLRPCKYSYYNTHHHHSIFYNSKFAIGKINKFSFYKPKGATNNAKNVLTVQVRAYNSNEEAAVRKDEERVEKKSFLSLEEAGLVEISGLSIHERFLCRLTISSLNLLRVIAEQEGCSIEELNAGKICDWFLKDKLKREQNIGSAVLQWDDDDPFAGQF